MGGVGSGAAGISAALGAAASGLRVLMVTKDLIGGATPRAIREHLGLNRPIYARTAAYGHFGREPDADGGFSWERTDLADELRRAF